MKLPYLNKIPYIRVAPSSLDPELQARPRVAQSSPKPTGYRLWLSVVWPLILHVFLTGGIAIFVTCYVHNTDFNLELRRPWAKLIDGTTRQWPHYAPLQTDITTILSFIIAILRLVSACWLGPLSWRYALILMEQSGLRPTDLRTLVSYRVTAIPPGGAPSTDKKLLRIVIWVALLVVLPVHLASPILTGSITWIASSPPPEYLSNASIVNEVVTNFRLWDEYMSDPEYLDPLTTIVESASFRASMTWGQDTSNTIMKRFVPSFSGLEINSTVNTVALPYFAVESFERIDDINSTVPGINPEYICSTLKMGNLACPYYHMLNQFAFMPNTPWEAQESMARSKVIDRWLTMYLNQSIASCWGLGCFSFAWVKFSAGAATCKHCRVSSFATVENDTALALEESDMTADALRMITHIVLRIHSNMDRSARIPSWGNPEEYVTGMLTRSYASAWMVLHEQLPMYNGQVTFNLTEYAVTLRATRALVNVPRVYIWLGLQSLVTVSGILFFYIQAQSNSPLLTDTALAAFHLDSSALYDGAYSQFLGGAVRKVELDGDYLRVKSE